jgi:hypothetical protein
MPVFVHVNVVPVILRIVPVIVTAKYTCGAGNPTYSISTSKVHLVPVILSHWCICGTDNSDVNVAPVILIDWCTCDTGHSHRLMYMWHRSFSQTDVLVTPVILTDWWCTCDTGHSHRLMYMWHRSLWQTDVHVTPVIMTDWCTCDTGHSHRLMMYMCHRSFSQTDVHVTPVILTDWWCTCICCAGNSQTDVHLCWYLCSVCGVGNLSMPRKANLHS